MKITQKLSLDLSSKGSRQMIPVKQGDFMTREVEISLLKDGEAWDVPSEAAIFRICYAKPDRTGGCYDKMPDDAPACTLSDNKILARLHPQMFTCPGTVACELQLLTQQQEQISTFNWFLQVEESPIGSVVSEDYFNLTLWGQLGDLSQLTTEVKTSLVASINELVSNIQNLGVEIDLLVTNTVKRPEFEQVAADVGLLNTIVIDDLNENAVRGVNGKRGDEVGVVSLDSSDIMVPSDEGLPKLGTVTELLNYGFQQIRTVESKANTAANQIPAINDALTQLNADYSGVIRSINGIAPAPGNGTVEITSSDITMEEEGYDWNGNVTDALDKVQGEIEEIQRDIADMSKNMVVTINEVMGDAKGNVNLTSDEIEMNGTDFDGHSMTDAISSLCQWASADKVNSLIEAKLAEIPFAEEVTFGG